MATHSSILACKNPMDRGAWGTIVHRVANSWIRLSDWAHKVLRGELPDGWAGKKSACNAGDPGSGRSPGEGIGHPLRYFWASRVTQLVKNSPAKKKEFTCNVGDLGSIPGLGRSPGEGKGYPLQYSGLENSMDCIVHGVTKSRTWLSDFHTQKCKRQILFKEILRWSPISLSLQYFEVIRYQLWVLHPRPDFFFLPQKLEESTALS